MAYAIDNEALTKLFADKFLSRRYKYKDTYLDELTLPELQGAIRDIKNNRDATSKHYALKKLHEELNRRNLMRKEKIS